MTPNTEKMIAIDEFSQKMELFLEGFNVKL